MHISDAVWSSGITAIALLIQTWLSNRREERRLNSEAVQREKDRLHTSSEAVATRSQAVEDHWRDRRLEAHAQLLTLMNQARQFLDASASDVVYGGEVPGRLPDETIRQVEEAQARVRLLGSRESSNAAEAVFGSFLLTQQVLGLAQLSRDRFDSATFAKSVGDFRSALDTYHATARGDIGTEV
jgi:hypothetical protein